MVKKRKRLVLDINGAACKKLPIPALFEHCQQAKVVRPLLCSRPFAEEEMASAVLSLVEGNDATTVPDGAVDALAEDATADDPRMHATDPSSARSGEGEPGASSTPEALRLQDDGPSSEQAPGNEGASSRPRRPAFLTTVYVQGLLKGAGLGASIQVSTKQPSP